MLNNNTSQKYCIKIPINTAVLYCEKKKIVTIIGSLKRKSLKLKIKLKILPLEKLIKVSSTPFVNVSNNEKKKIKALQGTTTALLKQVLIETSSFLCEKLRFVGVGYRAFPEENYGNQLLLFKLGYSHPIYFRIPAKINISFLKLTKLFIFGTSYQNVTQVAALIREYRKPEPYKGKGVLYDNEKIKLKEGKKI